MLCCAGINRNFMFFDQSTKFTLLEDDIVSVRRSNGGYLYADRAELTTCDMIANNGGTFLEYFLFRIILTSYHSFQSFTRLTASCCLWNWDLILNNRQRRESWIISLTASVWIILLTSSRTSTFVSNKSRHPKTNEHFQIKFIGLFIIFCESD